MTEKKPTRPRSKTEKDIRAQMSGDTLPITVHVRKEEKETGENLFQLSKRTQDNTLILSIRNTDFINKACHLLQHDNFEGEIAQELVKCIVSFYARYQKAPRENITDWIDKQIKDGKVKKDWASNIHILVKNLEPLETPEDPDVTLDLLQEVMDIKTIKIGAAEVHKLITKGKRDQARGILVDILEQTDPRIYEDPSSEIQPLHAPFPIHIIDGVAGDFARLHSKYLESPIEFFFMAFLTCLGNVLADKIQVITELDAQPRLYTLLLGESARTRKSTACLKSFKFFKETLSEDEFHMIHGTGSGEGVARKLEEKNPLLIYYDEAKSMVDKSSYKGSSLLSIINVLFDANTWHNPLKKEKDSADVENGYLSILACSTIDTYEKMFTDQFIDIGFTNRIFLVPGEGKRKDAMPPKIPEEKKKPVRERLLNVIESTARGIYLPVLPEAYARYHRWYHEETDLDSPYGRRIDTYGSRFMSLLAVNEGKEKVDLPIVEKVLELMEWQFQMRKIYEPIDMANKFAALEEKIRRKLQDHPKGLTEGVLRNRVRGDSYGHKMWGHAINNMRGAGEIRVIPKGKTKHIIPTNLISKR